MYFSIIQQFSKSLRNLDTFLHKAQQYAEHKKFDPNNICGLRLAPDMLMFTNQVQIACDAAKGAAAALAGKQPPKHEDNEKSLGELRTRIHSVVGYLDGFKADDFKHVQEDTVVKLPFKPGKGMHAPKFLLQRAIPNFFFHVTTAYDILRHAGVELGKADFLGSLDLLDV